MKLLGTLIALAAAVSAHGDHEQEPIAGPHKSLWYNTLPGDGGTQVWRVQCLEEDLLKIVLYTGRFGVLRNLDLWSSSLFALPGE